MEPILKYILFSIAIIGIFAIAYYFTYIFEKKKTGKERQEEIYKALSETITSELLDKTKEFAKGISDAMLFTFDKLKTSNPQLNNLSLLKMTLSLRPLWKQLNENNFIYENTKRSISISDADTIESLTWKVINCELEFACSELIQEEFAVCKSIAFEEYKKYFKGHKMEGALSDLSFKAFLFFINFVFVGSGFMIIGKLWIGLLYLLLYGITWTIRMEMGLFGSIYPFFVLFISEAHLFYLVSEGKGFDFSYKWSVKNAILFTLYFWALPFFSMNIFWASGHLSTGFLRNTGAILWGLIAGSIAYQRANKNWIRAIVWFLIVFFSNIIYAFPALIILFYLIVWYDGKSQIEHK